MATRTRRTADQNKVPCKNPGICTTRKAGKHIAGSFTQKKCEEIYRRRMAGEEITLETAVNVVPPGAAKRKEEADEIRTQMDGLRALADGWKDNPQGALDFVRWSQQFTDYSPFNRMMIHLQNPDATQVAARGRWDKIGREVSEDAKPLSIFVPGSRGQFPKKDEDGNPVLDENGKPVMIRTFVNRFKSVNVYDVSDTEGDTPLEIETEVMDEDGLREMVSNLEVSYFLTPSNAVLAADQPAFINHEGKVEYNSIASSPEQQLVNRLVATGMAVSLDLREQELNGREDKRPWTNAEHMYAGVAAAWAIGKEAGVDLSDLAVEQMSRYSGQYGTSTLATHATKVADHITLVRQGMPKAIADAMA